MRFGEKLRILRTHHGLTLKGLASALGFKAHGYLSELESGKKVPTVGLVLGVARLFNVTTDELLEDKMELNIFPMIEHDRASISAVFVERPPTVRELELFRLILSTYQDGTGMLANGPIRTLPGWRDFERSLALAFNGYASENKDIFDVRLPDQTRELVTYGVSCKMRRELDRVGKDGRVTIELSNSARKFWDYLGTKGINQANYKQHPFEVGVSLIDLVRGWHVEVSLESGGNVDLDGSFYLTLSWNRGGWYQLHQFALALPDPRNLSWYFPTYIREGTQVLGSHINGDDGSGTVFEWYGESGAQLKYYPLAQNAIWQSDLFQLEPLPQESDHGVLQKVQRYFPEQWSRISSG